MDYWREAVDCALDDAGVTATEQQREEIAGVMEGSHENYGMAFGHDVASANLRAAQDREKEDLERELARERNKVHCKECRGTGTTVSHGPVHSGYSQCWKCNGDGRHDP